MSAKPASRVRVTLAAIGNNSKVEVWADKQWLDISSCLYGCTVDTTVGEATTATLTLRAVLVEGHAEAADLDESTLRTLERLVSEAKADGRLK